MRSTNILFAVYAGDLGFHVALLMMLPMGMLNADLFRLVPYSFDETVMDSVVVSFLRFTVMARRNRMSSCLRRTSMHFLFCGCLFSCSKLVYRLLDFRRGTEGVIDDFIIVTSFGFLVSMIEFMYERSFCVTDSIPDESLTWKRLFRFANGHWARLIVGVVVLVFRLPFSLAVPHFVSEAIGALLGSDWGRFTQSCWLLVVSGTIDAILDFWCVYIFATVQQEIVYVMRTSLFESLLSHPMSFFDKSSIGEIQSRLNSDTAEMANNLSWVFRFAIEAVVRVAGILIYMFVCSWRLGLLVLVTIPVNAYANTFFSQWMSQNAKDAQDTLAVANTIAQESFGAVQTLKSFSGEEKTFHKYKDALVAYKRLQYKAVIVSSTFYMFVSTFLMNTLGQATIIVYGGLLSLHGLIATERLVSFLLYRGTLQFYFSSLMETWVNLMKCASISDRIFQLLVTEQTENFEANIASQFIDVSLKPPDIKFDNISHRYENRPGIEVLTNVSFTAESGKCCAIVGQSGSGKSSLISMLLRLYSPTCGSIIINGTRVSSIPLQTLRGRLCSVVSQEPVLFGGTIRDNVLYALSETQTRHLSESTISEMIHRALAIACIADFVESLPQKIFTEIGDRGVTLSGGQKQRIAIARAIITNPPILLLDEAMSALDPESEVAVQRALNSAMKSRTTIMVSHRISSVIEMADYVVVMHKGAIVEKGVPRTLLEDGSGKSMSLRMLYQSQQGIASV